jgi:hypothetical protein
MSDIENWLDHIWQTLDGPWVRAWFSHQPGRPETLYHYGQAQGLLSILDSQCLWATDAHYLNDASELRYTTDIMRDAVEAMAAETASTVVRAFLAGLPPGMGEGGQRPVYTVSFSEEGDILSQWRAYAGTTGYALGLATRWWDMIAVLDTDPARRPGPLRLRKVLYGEEEQRRLLRTWLDPVCAALAEASVQFGEAATLQTVQPRLRQHVTDLLRLLSPCLKHPAFAEEREWRLIYMPDTTQEDGGAARHAVRFRPAAIGLVPYVPLSLPANDGPYKGRLPVTQVYYGPSEHPDLVARALAMLLETHGYVAPHTQVKGSRAPLRV